MHFQNLEGHFPPGFFTEGRRGLAKKLVNSNIGINMGITMGNNMGIHMGIPHKFPMNSLCIPYEFPMKSLSVRVDFIVAHFAFAFEALFNTLATASIRVQRLQGH